VLAVVYVPGVLLLTSMLARFGGGTGTSFQRDYAPLLTCSGMAWTGSLLPFVIASRFFPFDLIVLGIGSVGLLYFLVLMFLAVRTIFGLENWTAVLIIGLSWLPLVAAVFLWGPLHYLLGWIASPFFLFYAYYYLGGELGNLGSGLRSRQTYRRMLDAAAVNPHDGEAQYQLGLIYQQRRQYTEAIQRFKNAIAIDPGETDAHFQLGRIAREQGRRREALEHFAVVLNQDEKHSQDEILRELGAVYLAAGQYKDALEFLDQYVGKHAYDPEGLYYDGQALEGMERPREARARYQQAVQAASTAPRYRRRVIAKWSRLAQKRAASLSSR
jgi:tetratricopeptide (TPR) repeat protein